MSREEIEVEKAEDMPEADRYCVDGLLAKLNGTLYSNTTMVVDLNILV